MVDRIARADDGFQEFLRHYSDRTLIYSGESSEFIEELSRRWREQHPVAMNRAASQPAPAERMRRHAVFLSYASEDRAVVERIQQQLEEAGIDTWLDREELAPGSTWAKVIQASIESAAAFVPR